MSRPSWFPDWSGEVCAIVGGGASVERRDVERLRGRCRVAVINNSYELAPWADMLYGGDGRWWKKYPDAFQFEGFKVTLDRDVALHHKIHKIDLMPEDDPNCDRIIVDDAKSRIGRGGNGGFQLINLLICCGVRAQIWMGLDFVGEHWHGRHPDPLRNPRQPTLDRWRATLDREAATLSELRVDAVNVSSVSALTAYPKMSVSEALAHFGC